MRHRPRLSILIVFLLYFRELQPLPLLPTFLRLHRPLLRWVYRNPPQALLHKQRLYCRRRYQCNLKRSRQDSPRHSHWHSPPLCRLQPRSSRLRLNLPHSLLPNLRRSLRLNRCPARALPPCDETICPAVSRVAIGVVVGGMADMVADMVDRL